MSSDLVFYPTCLLWSFQRCSWTQILPPIFNILVMCFFLPSFPSHQLQPKIQMSSVAHCMSVRLGMESASTRSEERTSSLTVFFTVLLISGWREDVLFLQQPLVNLIRLTLVKNGFRNKTRSSLAAVVRLWIKIGMFRIKNFSPTCLKHLFPPSFLYFLLFFFLPIDFLIFSSCIYHLDR
jgi:hypothetical protein